MMLNYLAHVSPEMVKSGLSNYRQSQTKAAKLPNLAKRLLQRRAGE